MARSDLLLALVRAASRGDNTLLRRALEALIAEERSKQHHVFADRLEAQLRDGFASHAVQPTASDGKTQSLVHEVIPRRKLDELILPPAVRCAIAEVAEEHHRVDLLRSYGVEPRNRVLLQGSPGNGKTVLAEALADALVVPLVVVRYEEVIGSYLGETAMRLLKLFQYVATRRCVLFFDEFDTVGKERGDTHETGEIKRVVSSLLLQVDALPSHVVVVAATNHPELLDRAVWRRFQVRLWLPKPAIPQIVAWFDRFQADFEQLGGVNRTALARRLHGLSFAEIEEFGMDLRRRWILAEPHADVRQILATRLSQLDARNRPKSLVAES